MKGFVYIWRHLPTEQYYIGSHQGHTQDGYISSSDLINQSIQADPEDWTREILAQGEIQEMRDLETAVLKEAFEDGSCLNQSYGAGVPIKLKAQIKPKDRTKYSTEVERLKELLQ